MSLAVFTLPAVVVSAFSGPANGWAATAAILAILVAAAVAGVAGNRAERHRLNKK